MCACVSSTLVHTLARLHARVIARAFDDPQVHCPRFSWESGLHSRPTERLAHRVLCRVVARVTTDSASLAEPQAALPAHVGTRPWAAAQPRVARDIVHVDDGGVAAVAAVAPLQKRASDRAISISV
jgi:hypothetical protein